MVTSLYFSCCDSSQNNGFGCGNLFFQVTLILSKRLLAACLLWLDKKHLFLWIDITFTWAEALSIEHLSQVTVVPSQATAYKGGLGSCFTGLNGLFRSFSTQLLSLVLSSGDLDPLGRQKMFDYDNKSLKKYFSNTKLNLMVQYALSQQRVFSNTRI